MAEAERLKVTFCVGICKTDRFRKKNKDILIQNIHLAAMIFVLFLSSLAVLRMFHCAHYSFYTLLIAIYFLSFHPSLSHLPFSPPARFPPRLSLPLPFSLHILFFYIFLAFTLSFTALLIFSCSHFTSFVSFYREHFQRFSLSSPGCLLLLKFFLNQGDAFLPFFRIIYIVFGFHKKITKHSKLFGASKTLLLLFCNFSFSCSSGSTHIAQYSLCPLFTHV